MQFISELMECVKDLRNEVILLQNSLIECRKQVQAKLSNCKTEQLEMLKNTAKSSVVDLVKAT